MTDDSIETIKLEGIREIILITKEMIILNSQTLSQRGVRSSYIHEKEVHKILDKILEMIDYDR